MFKHYFHIPHNLKTRQSWIDNVKMFSMLPVIFGHTQGALFSENLPGVSTIMFCFVAWNMYLFTFISGLCGFNRINKIDGVHSFFRYLVSIFERLVIPMISLAIIDIILMKDISILLHLWWFMKMLFYLMSCFATFKLLGVLFKFDSFCFEVIGTLVVMLLWNGTSTQEMVVPFVAGLICRKYDIFKYNVSSKLYIILSFIFILVFILCFKIIRPYEFYEFDINLLYEKGLLYVFFLRQLIAFTLMFIIIQFFIKWSFNYSLFSYCGTQTLGLYIYSASIQDILKLKLGNYSDSELYVWIYVILATLAILVVCMFILRLFEMNRITKYLFLGIRVRK